MAVQEDLNEQVSTHKTIPGPLARKSLARSHKSTPTTGAVAQKIQKSPVRWETDLGKSEAQDHAKGGIEELVKWPTASLVRQLTAVIYAESTSRDLGGENDAEKLAIGATFINRAYYADWKPVGRKHDCFNSDFGDGSLWGAITAPNGSVAVGGVLWTQLIDQDGHFRGQEALKKILKLESQRLHYNLSVQAATQLLTGLTQTSQLVSISGLGNRVPIGFDRSSTSHPSPRWERVGQIGKRHYFYAFKPGNECEEIR